MGFKDAKEFQPEDGENVLVKGHTNTVYPCVYFVNDDPGSPDLIGTFLIGWNFREIAGIRFVVKEHPFYLKHSNTHTLEWSQYPNE